MTFNILFGGQQRFEDILKVVREQAPDVLVLQECLHWDDGHRLEAVAEAMQADFTHLGLSNPRSSGLRYHVALLVRHSRSDGPAVLHVRTHAEPRLRAHCMVEAKLLMGDQPLTVFGTHFVHENENLRFVEAHTLLAMLPEPEEFKRGNYLLVGDLNALSRVDPYPANLDSLLRQVEVTKYCSPPRFDVIEHLLDYGWVDTLYAKGPPESWVTAPRDKNGIHIDYRVDYILASPPMIGRLEQTRIVPLQHLESDHYPVIANFKT